MPRVVVGGQEQTVRVPQVARGFGQFEKSHLVVVSHQHRLHVRSQGAVIDGGAGVVRLLHAGDARLLQLPAQSVAADDEHLAADLDDVPQVQSRAVRRAEDLLQHHVGEAQPAELGHIILAGPGAVVGDEHHVLAVADQRAHHLRRARDRVLPVPYDPVAVEQDEVLRLQQISQLRTSNLLAAFEAKGARHPGFFLGLLRLSPASGPPCQRPVHNVLEAAGEATRRKKTNRRLGITLQSPWCGYIRTDRQRGYINIDE